jgi:hypothetical protein
MVPQDINKIRYWDRFKMVLSKIRGSQSAGNCMDIYHHYSGPNMELNDHNWFKPFVGMISMYSDHFINGPSAYRTWQLISYYTH